MATGTYVFISNMTDVELRVIYHWATELAAQPDADPINASIASKAREALAGAQLAIPTPVEVEPTVITDQERMEKHITEVDGLGEPFVGF